MAFTGLNNFYGRTRAARKILMVDFGFLGDALQLLPALWEIKRHYPDTASTLDRKSEP